MPANTPLDLKAELAALGLNQSSLARLMVALGDDRDEKNVLRSINRMAAGDARVSGEMRALLGLIRLVPDVVLPIARPGKQAGQTALAAPGKPAGQTGTGIG